MSMRITSWRSFPSIKSHIVFVCLQITCFTFWQLWLHLDLSWLRRFAEDWNKCFSIFICEPLWKTTNGRNNVTFFGWNPSISFSVRDGNGHFEPLRNKLPYTCRSILSGWRIWKFNTYMQKFLRRYRWWYIVVELQNDIESRLICCPIDKFCFWDRPKPNVSSYG